jgi:hypothetical protein
MKKGIFTAFILTFSVICNAQQKHSGNPVLKFAKFEIVKAKILANNVITFESLTVVMDKPSKARSSKRIRL